jgi:hypothetical protein
MWLIYTNMGCTHSDDLPKMYTIITFKCFEWLVLDSH